MTTNTTQRVTDEKLADSLEYLIALDLRDERERSKAKDATIAEQAREIERLNRHIKLHAGDCLSLDNEVALMRSHWEAAESLNATLSERVRRLEQIEKAVRTVWPSPNEYDRNAVPALMAALATSAGGKEG